MESWIYVHDLDPILVTLGPLRIGWYGLMYALTFLTGYVYLLRISRHPGSSIPSEEVSNLLTYIILGVILGGRLGWVIFYGGMPYLMEPWRVVQTWKGGMSFHGGILGVICAVVLYGRRHGISPVAVNDFTIGWGPMGLFLGRIGNFINGELYGKPTGGDWGVIFPRDPQQVPRHPSQLYEAVGEGLLIFIVLQLVRMYAPPRVGLASALFLLLYGIARISVEFVRLPDADIGYMWGFVTRGQLLSLPMLIAGVVWVAYLFTRKAQPAA